VILHTLGFTPAIERMAAAANTISYQERHPGSATRKRAC
jgi:hypothetical protein